MDLSLSVARPLVALLVACGATVACGSDDSSPRPQTQPVDAEATPPAGTETPENERTYALGEKFTVAWTETSEPPTEVNLTIAVSDWRCGGETTADTRRAAQAAEESYGEFADPPPQVAPGYQLCVAAMTISNTGKKHLQHEPVTTALDASQVEYNQDDDLTRYIGFGATFGNRETFGGATVSLNPRESADSAVAYQIPADTTITHLRYAGSDLPFDPAAASTALVAVA